MEHPALAINPGQRLRSHLAQFANELLQALLRGGKYAHAPLDEVQGQRRITALHALFSGLMKDRDEFCLVRDAVAGSGLRIEGVLAEPVAVGDLLRTGIGAAQHPVLASRFGTCGLVSVSLGAGIDAGELGRFVQDFASLLAQAQGREESTARDRLFGDQPNVFVLWADQLLGGDRPMSWPVRRAASRLRREWEAVDAGGQHAPGGGPTGEAAGRGPVAGSREARRRALRRAVLALRRTDWLAELLRQADLIAVAHTAPDVASVEEEIVAALPPAQIGPALARLSRDAAGGARATDAASGAQEASRLRRTLVALAEAAVASGAPEAEGGLAAFFRSRAVPLRDLSAPLQEYVLVRHLVRGLLEDTAANLERLCRDAAAHAPLLGPLAAELLRRDHYAPARSVLALALEVTAAERTGREALGRLIPLLLAKIETGPREWRTTIADMLVLLGPLGVEPLIQFLARSGDRGARRSACDVLERIGAPAVPALAAHLEREGLPWYVARNLLLLLGAIRDPGPTDLRRWLRHGDPRVREAAIQAVAQIQGREAEGALVGLLRDAHPRVRARSLKALADVESSHACLVQFLEEAVRRKALTEPEEDEQVQILACAVLERLAASPGGAPRHIGTVLAEALEARPRHALLGVFGGGFRAKGPAVRAAIAEALGALRAARAARA